MKKSLSFLAIAAAATVLLSLPSTAKAQVAFGGTFRGPHGTISIGGGAPFLPQVGAYVPSPYDDEVYEGDDGYGFYYNSEWIPCTRYGSRWIIVEPGFGYGRGYAYGRGGYGYARPFRGQGRVGFEGRRGFDGRRDFQGQGQRQFQGQGQRQFQGQGRREFQGQGQRQFQGQGQGRQNRGSRNDGRSNRDSRRGNGRQ